MKLTSLAIGAVLVPALAYAQTYDPNQPQPQPQPAPAPTQQPQDPTPTTIVNPPPPPPQPQAQAPVVVVPQQQTQPPPAPQPVYINPEGEEVYDNWNAPVFATGALVFAGSYGASAIVAGSSNHVGADRLYVPVVGPWLALNDWGDCPIANPSCDRNTTDKVLLVADGVFQAAGLIGMIDGILAPSRHRVVTRVDRTVHITPSHNGVTVFGHF